MKASTRAATHAIALVMALSVHLCARAADTESSPWGTSLHHAMSESTHDRKPVFVYYANDWDPWCRRMEETFRDREVRNALSGFHLVRIDPNKSPEDTNKYDVYICPSMVIVDHRGDELFHVTGFRTPVQLMREFARAGARSAGAAGASPAAASNPPAPDESRPR